jgi:hypothetical protein
MQVKTGQAPSSSKPGRNAMTLVRGNVYVEPLELAGEFVYAPNGHDHLCTH